MSGWIRCGFGKWNKAKQTILILHEKLFNIAGWKIPTI